MSITVVEGGGSSTHHLDALDFVGIDAVVVDVVIATFSAQSLAIYEEDHHLVVHPLIGERGQLTHCVKTKLDAWESVLQQLLHVEGIDAINLGTCHDACDHRYIFEWTF